MKPIKITLIYRSMGKAKVPQVGHANKILDATNKSSVQPTATTLPAKVDKAEAELEANRTLPTGIDFFRDKYSTETSSNSSTKQADTESTSSTSTTQAEAYENTMPRREYGSTSGSSTTINTGPLLGANSNSTTRSTITVENPKPVHSRSYAQYSVNNADPPNPDPQAAKNNPVVQKGSFSFQHDDIHRIRCIRPECQGKACIGLCDAFKDRKAVGNTTTSKKPVTDTTQVDLGVEYKANAKKQNKDQYGKMYKKNNETKATHEDKQGTQLINQPNNIKKIIDNEDQT